MAGINSNLKFSYPLIRGSVEKRQEFVSKTNEKMFDSLFPIFQKDCYMSKFKKVYSKIIPEQKEVEIVPMQVSPNDDFCAAQDYIYDDDNKIVGLTLELPTQKAKNIIKRFFHSIIKPKDRQIPKDELLSVMHENTHILDTLANPKQTALTEKLSLEGKFSKKRDKWYGDNLYKREGSDETQIKPKKVLGRVKKVTKEFLKGKPIEEKIAHLQDARYQLEQERHAYAEEVKYAKILQSRGVTVTEYALKDKDKLFLFTEKINLLKSMAFEFISKERSRMARRHGN